MKSLQESLLDDEEDLVNNTDIKNILFKTFPEESKVLGIKTMYPYYNWTSDFFKKVCNYDIDEIRISWINDFNIFSILLHGNPDKNLNTLQLSFSNSKALTLHKAKIFTIDIDYLPYIKNIKEMQKKAYEVLKLLKDNILNIEKLFDYIEYNKLNKNRNKNIRISLQDLYNIFK